VNVTGGVARDGSVQFAVQHSLARPTPQDSSRERAVAVPGAPQVWVALATGQPSAAPHRQRQSARGFAWKADGLLVGSRKKAESYAALD
jgi:hypothetical protein